MSAPALKDRAIFLAWIAGILLAGMLLWSLTQPFQARALLRAVNKMFISMEDSRRLSAPLGRRPISANPMGVWYSTLDSGTNMFVFAIMWDGILIPCGALVSPEGKVAELLPLTEHARRLLDRLPPKSVVQMYVRRVEAAAAKRSGQ
ncbi:MAG: hypothetical protein LBS37_11250 [Treponema sp.]|jgi:hypothetical protein|nr:hypothetical protein [Treponema sp.]